MILLFYELIFTLTIIKNFMTSFVRDGETIVIRDLMEIATRYKKSSLSFDLIVWCPMVFFLNNSKE